MHKLITVTAVSAALCLSSHAQVVAAWDFGDTDASTAGWKTFALGDSNSDEMNGLTLTQAAAGSWSARSKTPDFTQTDFSTPLLAAGADEMNDGFDLAGTQDFTLSGLEENRTYRLQFIGGVTHTDVAQARNLMMSIDADAATYDLLDYSTLTNGHNAGYSAYAEFTADNSRDVVITFSELSAGQKVIAGLIVEDLGKEEPPEEIVPPVITHTTVIEGGTNMVLTWTSEQGQLFDIVKSTDMKSWTTIVDDMPASASTQTTYTVAIDEDTETEFYQVWSVDGRLPNMILLFADDLGYGDLACYGHPYAKTPNLDRLAEEGTLFRKFNVTGMTCNPSRTGILSSWHPNSYPLSTADYGFDQAAYGDAQNGYVDHPTVMELLKENADYRTGFFGKWHIGEIHEWSGGEIGVGTKGDPAPGTYGCDEIDVMGGGGSDPRGRDEIIYQSAIAFIEANKNTNFYINVMGRVTHAPVDPRPDLVASAGYTNLHTYFDRNDFAGQQIQDIFDGVIANGGNITNSMANYQTEVYYLDQFVGELLDTLDEHGLSENTIVAFSSDQGAALPSYDEIPVPAEEYNLVGWSGGLRGQKHYQYEGGIRSPFIVRWPGHVPAGKVNHDSIVSALDWLPTLCDVAGVDLSGIEVQGESMVDVFKGAERSRSGAQFWNSSMKMDDWRAYFVNATSTTMVELYDLSTDLDETDNLVETRPDIVAQMTALWQDWINSLP